MSHARNNVPSPFNKPTQPVESDAPRELPFPASSSAGNSDFAARDARLAVALATICSRDDGWLRLIPSRDGTLSYAKWKFTHGCHSGKYIMVTQPWHQALDLVCLLVDKLAQVDAGTARPTLDKYFALD